MPNKIVCQTKSSKKYCLAKKKVGHNARPVDVHQRMIIRNILLMSFQLQVLQRLNHLQLALLLVPILLCLLSPELEFLLFGKLPTLKLQKERKVLFSLFLKN